MWRMRKEALQLSRETKEGTGFKSGNGELTKFKYRDYFFIF